MLDWYRGEDAGDLKRSEFNELVENWTCLNALERKTWKIVPKVVMDEELVQNIVMDEELIQNIVMGGHFVKNFVMDAKIDPKVVWICPYARLADGAFCNPVVENCWKNLLMIMNRGC